MHLLCAECCLYSLSHCWDKGGNIFFVLQSFSDIFYLCGGNQTKPNCNEERDDVTDDARGGITFVGCGDDPTAVDDNNTNTEEDKEEDKEDKMEIRRIKMRIKMETSYHRGQIALYLSRPISPLCAEPVNPAYKRLLTTAPTLWRPPI